MAAVQLRGHGVKNRVVRRKRLGSRGRGRQRDVPAEVFAAEDASLLDLVDNLLTRGVMISGDVVLGLARVELIYLRLSALLCAADRVLPGRTATRGRR